jgi:hypothetical protein
MSAMVARLDQPAEVKRFARRAGDGEAGVKKVDLGEIPLEMAKVQLGTALKKTIDRSGSAYKDFGDPGLVSRAVAGEVPGWLARAWQRKKTRRELLIALAEGSDGVAKARTEITFDE